MKKQRMIYISVLLVFSIAMTGQEKQVFKFIEINKKKSWDGGYIQRDFEFSRIYHKNNIFEEKGILPGLDSFFFKVKKKNWYVKNLKRWDVFYLFGKTISPKIFSHGRWFLLKFEKYDSINTKNCLVFTFQNDKYSTSKGDKTIVNLAISDFPSTQYWFNEDLGIVKIKSGDFEYIRQDVFE